MCMIERTVFDLVRLDNEASSVTPDIGRFAGSEGAQTVSKISG